MNLEGFQWHDAIYMHHSRNGNMSVLGIGRCRFDPRWTCSGQPSVLFVCPLCGPWFMIQVAELPMTTELRYCRQHGNGSIALSSYRPIEYEMPYHALEYEFLVACDWDTDYWLASIGWLQQLKDFSAPRKTGLSTTGQPVNNACDGPSKCL